MKYAFIGSGSMARAIMSGMVRSGTPGGEIAVINPGNPESCRAAAELCGAVPAWPEALESASVVVIAVKPQSFADAAPYYAGYIAPEALVVTIMAGISAKTVSEAFGNARVVRVMPNLALAAGMGAAGVAPGPGATEEDMREVLSMFSAAGIALPIEEGQINDVAALSGSGAAYLYYVIEALRDAAIEDGMQPETAALLAKQTLLGAARQLELEDAAPEELRRRITSKKGTTEAAILAMTEMKLPEAVKAGFRANKRRSEELSQG